jgi:hypothetical protein
MRNKLKIAAVVVALVVGIVLYKQHYDKNNTDEDKKDTKRTASKPNPFSKPN